jgi:hypothetical protein
VPAAGSSLSLLQAVNTGSMSMQASIPRNNVFFMFFPVS